MDFIQEHFVWSLSAKLRELTELRPAAVKRNKCHFALATQLPE